MRRFSLYTLAILVLLTALELGFRARGYLDRALFQPTLSADGKIRVLLIGDSILGTQPAPGPGTVLGETLETLRPHVFEVINKSVPGQSSGTAAASIGDWMKEYHPQLVVLMLGKGDMANADWNDRKPSYAFKLRDWASHLRIYRLLLFSEENFGALAEKFKPAKAVPADEIVDDLRDKGLNNQMTDVWNWFEHQPEREWNGRFDKATQCLLKIERAQAAVQMRRSDADIFTRAMLDCAERAQDYSTDQQKTIFYRTGTTLRRTPHLDLAKEYLAKALTFDGGYVYAEFEMAWQMISESNDCARAIPYFKKGLELEPDRRQELRRLFGCMYSLKQFSEGAQFFAHVLPRVEKNRSLVRIYVREMKSSMQADAAPTSDLLHGVPEDSDSLMGAAWASRRSNLHERADSLFEMGDRYDSMFRENFDRNAYTAVVERSLAGGARVLALQYPNEVDGPVLEVVGAHDRGVSFLGLRDVLLRQLSQHDTLEVFDEDFNHLSKIGSQVAAQAISAQIISVFAK